MESQYLIDNYGDEITAMMDSADALFVIIKNIGALKTAYNNAVDSVVNTTELDDSDKGDILERINRFTSSGNDYDGYLNKAMSYALGNIIVKSNRLGELFNEIMEDYISVTDGKTWGDLMKSGEMDLAGEINSAALEVNDMKESLDKKINKIKKQIH